MSCEDDLSRVRALSDDDLLLGLSGLVATQRRTAAEVVAHLGEVEERRLHLLGGHASMFAYCITRLGMSEDEAYLRLEVARLVRRFPFLFEKLARGSVSLSVAALLRRSLDESNCPALLEAVSGKTMRQAREVLAAWFPQPDVLPSMRRLPARAGRDAPGLGSDPADGERASGAPLLPSAGPCAPSSEGPAPATGLLEAAAAPDAPGRPAFDVGAGFAGRAQASAAQSAHRTRSTRADRIEPLSPGRYKLQLTVSSELKAKLERARDLLRHAVPSGELAELIERGLDILLEQTLKRRFAVAARSRAPRASTPKPSAAPPAAVAAPHHARSAADTGDGVQARATGAETGSARAGQRSPEVVTACERPSPTEGAGAQPRAASAGATNAPAHHPRLVTSRTQWRAAPGAGQTACAAPAARGSSTITLRPGVTAARATPTTFACCAAPTTGSPPSSPTGARPSPATSRGAEQSPPIVLARARPRPGPTTRRAGTRELCEQRQRMTRTSDSGSGPRR